MTNLTKEQDKFQAAFEKFTTSISNSIQEIPDQKCGGSMTCKKNVEGTKHGVNGNSNLILISTHKSWGNPSLTCYTNGAYFPTPSGYQLSF